jgi:hypothetical protein
MSITGDGPRGPAYAVYDFLETLGCGFWNSDVETIPVLTNLTIQVGFEKTEAPVMEWRQTMDYFATIPRCLKLRANSGGRISNKEWKETLGAHPPYKQINHSFCTPSAPGTSSA